MGACPGTAATLPAVIAASGVASESASSLAVTEELTGKCIAELDAHLRVTPLQYTVSRGEQKDEATYDELKAGDSFRLRTNETDYFTGSAQSAVKYDLIGKLTEATQLTRKTIAAILTGISPAVFAQFRTNPESFIKEAARLINEQKATVIVEHISYNPTEDSHTLDIFTQPKKENLSQGLKVNHHIYDYVFTDSGVERTFAGELDASTEVVVYAKMTFFISTPVGNYNPDWAIAFNKDKVKHVYFIAETKGSMSSMDLRQIEESQIDCAWKFFAKITSEQVKYNVVDGYGKLMELVK